MGHRLNVHQLGGNGAIMHHYAYVCTTSAIVRKGGAVEDPKRSE